MTWWRSYLICSLRRCSTVFLSKLDCQLDFYSNAFSTVFFCQTWTVNCFSRIFTFSTIVFWPKFDYQLFFCVITRLTTIFLIQNLIVNWFFCRNSSSTISFSVKIWLSTVSFVIIQLSTVSSVKYQTFVSSQK